MQPWLIYAILALVIWGFWGFFPKLSTGYIEPRSAIVFQSIAAVVVGIIVLLFALKLKPEMHPRGVLFAALTGVTGIIGALFFMYALSSGGKTAAVVMLTALYPVITIALSFIFLHETVTFVQSVGILLAMLSIILISTQ